MTRDKLDKGIDLYTTIDYKNDSRINAFVKAGSNAILFSLIAVGYFLGNSTIPIIGHQNPILHLFLSIIVILLYSISHDLVHYIISKILNIKLKLNFKFIFPYIQYEGDIESKTKYYALLLAPLIIWMIILIPLQIIISILFPDWFWLCYIVIILNVFTSVDDVAFIIYSCKYKKSYLQISENSINVYFDTSLFKKTREKERQKYQDYVTRRENKKERINQLKNAPKLGKDIYKNQQSRKQAKDKTDIDDLSKLDQ